MDPKGKAICVLPWNHLATHPDGHVSLCCRVNFPANAGFSEDKNRQRLNLSNDRISAIRNSFSFQEARAEMIDGKMPLACQGCENEEKAGIRSKRNAENENFEKSFMGILANPQIKTEDGIEFLELRLGNKCNLKCRTCNPNSSSSWVNDYKAVSEKLSFLTRYTEPSTDWIDSAKFWDDLLEHSQNLRVVYINGGEPALIERHWSFLENLIQKGWAQKVRLTYNSNITVISPRAFEIWNQFKSVHMSASIDDIGERNSYLRPPSKWSVIERNLLRLKESKVHLAITQTISAMNIYYYPEFREWSDRIGIYAEPNFVFDPPFLSVGALPLVIRQKIFDRIHSSIRGEDLAKFEHWCLGEEKPDLWTQFKQYTEELDRVRGESFSRTFEEFHKLTMQHC